MNTLSIPVVAMTSISLYVGFYHLLIYLRLRQSRENLTFALLCFAIVFYDAFCTGLYNASSAAEGVQWQRAQFIALTLFIPAFLWFVSDYTHQRPGIATYLFSAFYIIALIVQLADRSSLTFPLDQPSIKNITLPYIQPIVYYEVALGPFTTIQGIVGVLASTYILILGIRYFQRGYKQEAIPLILAILFMYAAGLHDTLVSNGVYHFIYLIEYAYLSVILLMAYSLSNTIVGAVMAKEELRKSEERFRSLVETTSDWVWEIDVNCRYAYASPQVHDLLGYKPEEIVGRSPLHLMFEQEAKRVDAIFEQALQQSKPLVSVENIFLHKDGRQVVLDTSAVPFFDENGELAGYRGINRDITGRKQVEKALQAKTDELDRYFTSSLDLLCIADIDGYFRRLNPEWERTLGYPIAELEGRQFLEFVHPEDLEATHAAISRLAAQEEILNFENRYRCKDGSYRWIEWRSYPAEKMIYAVARDITEHKNAVEALSEKNHFIVSLLRAIPVAVFYKDREGRYLGCNDTFTKIMGVTAEEIRGKTVHELWPSDLADKYHQMDLELMRNKEHQEYEYQVKARDGKIHPVIYAKDVYLDENGAVTGLVGAFLDITERKQMEEALRDSEQKFRLFVEQSSDGLVFTDEQGVIIEWNQTQEQLTGISRQESIGLPLWEVQSNLLPAHMRAARPQNQLKQRVLLALETGQADFLNTPAEVVLFRHDGTKVVIQQMTFAIRTNKGFRLGAIIRDITQLKQAEDELRASWEKYRTLVEASPIGIWTSRNQVIAYANPAALKIFGATDSSEIVGKSSFDFIHPDYHAVVKERIAQMLETKKVVPLLEEKYVRLDGSVVDVEVTAAPLITSEGISMQVFFQDITKRKLAEQALRESEERLRQIASSLRETIWLRDAKTRQVLYVNPAFEQLTGWACESFYKNPDIVIDAIHPDDKAEVVEALAQRFKGMPYNKEHRIIRRDGGVRWISSRSVPVRNEAGEVFRWASIMEEITERKQAEAERERLIAELENRNAELERFTYTVSHDLKAPLITIRGFLGFVEQDAQAGNLNRLKDDIQRISAATEKMQRLLDELLELSRIGRLMNPPANIVLGDLVQEALKLMEGRLRERNVEVKIQDDLPIIFGDAQRLSEVIQNLLDNAVKFMGEQPQPVIEVGAGGEENGIPVIYVRDNGIGIAPEHHERIFGLFNKLDPGAEGTGVGLAIVKRIIEVHGGRIWVESEEGKGATFYFTVGKGTPTSA